MNRPLPNRKPPRKRRKENIELIIGLVLGILTPIFGVAVLKSEYPNIDQVEVISPGSLNFLMVRLLTFAIIINAGLFFMGIYFRREPLARGVLIATILSALAVLYFKFFA